MPTQCSASLLLCMSVVLAAPLAPLRALRAPCHAMSLVVRLIALRIQPLPVYFQTSPTAPHITAAKPPPARSASALTTRNHTRTLTRMLATHKTQLEQFHFTQPLLALPHSPTHIHSRTWNKINALKQHSHHHVGRENNTHSNNNKKLERRRKWYLMVHGPKPSTLYEKASSRGNPLCRTAAVVRTCSLVCACIYCTVVATGRGSPCGDGDPGSLLLDDPPCRCC